MAVTRIQQINFIKEIAPIALEVCKRRGYGNAQVWCCIAQACDESAYGTSKRMRNSNAYFGIKANKYWIDQAKYGGLVYNSKTKECYDGKNYTDISACFRAYRCMKDSVEDYFDLLNYNRYKASLKATTVKDAITLIKKGGYATAPSYVDTICNFYLAHKDLIESYSISKVVKEEVPKAEKSNEAIAYEVLRGLWGNGAVRRNKLTQAGYDYIAIQRLVNAMA